MMNEKTVDKYHFSLSNRIGSGAFGQVFKAIDTKLNIWVAIKMIPKSIIQNDPYLMDSLKREISVMQRLKGANVVRLLDMLESTTNYYIVQEYCKDGDLEQYLYKQQYLTEIGAVRILVDIMSGFIELLQQGIIHRDLKPANILVHQGTFKLGDFGFAKCMQNFSKDILESKVGTPLYMAPQILLQQKYTSKSDIWSIGCIFYQCLFRRTPWIANSIMELIDQIHKQPITFPTYVSSDARDFIQKCLKINEEERIDWNSLYTHPLVKEKFKDYVTSVKDLEQKAEYILSDLRSYVSINRIDLMETFKKLKINNNQYLTFKELQTLLNEINPNLTRQEIEFIFNIIDVDNDNKIDFLEFQSCLQQHHVRMSLMPEYDHKLDQQQDVFYSPLQSTEQKANTVLQQIREQIKSEDMSLVKLFRKYDTNRNEVLDLQEFSKFIKQFNQTIANDEILVLYHHFDNNSNGGIDFHQFKKTLSESTIIK